MSEFPELPQLQSQELIFWNWNTGLETCLFFFSQTAVLIVVQVINIEVKNCGILDS